MQVRFHTNDNEPLANDLTRYEKGQRRVARLMTLATYGLMYLQQVARDPNSIPLAVASGAVSPRAEGSTRQKQTDPAYEYKMTVADVADVFGDSIQPDR
jgi:hypothetical protein